MLTFTLILLVSLGNAASTRTVSLVVLLFKEAKVSNVAAAVTGSFDNVNTNARNIHFGFLGQDNYQRSDLILCK